MSPELEKLAVETEAALRTLGDLPMEFTLKAAFRQVWNEAIEAASEAMYDEVVPDSLGEEELQVAGVVLECMDTIRKLKEVE